MAEKKYIYSRRHVYGLQGGLGEPSGVSGALLGLSRILSGISVQNKYFNKIEYT